MERRERLDLVYQSLDEMAGEIKRSAPDDPNRPGKACSWPQTFIEWRNAVITREDERDREPLSQLQWAMLERYMANQHGFPAINEYYNLEEQGEAEGVGC